MEEQGGINVHLQREFGGKYHRFDGSFKAYWPEESWRSWKLSKLRPSTVSFPCSLENCLCGHSGCWVGRRGKFDALQHQVWKRNCWLSSEGSQGESWASESELEGNCRCYQFQIQHRVYRGSFRLTMAKLRERQPCRRGPSRGSSSRSPAANEHHHCCCCYCHRRARATPLPIRQYVEVGGSCEGTTELPAFGSVVFTLPSTEDNAGVNAHISIMFTKIPDEEHLQDPQEKLLEDMGREISLGKEHSSVEKNAAEVLPASVVGSLGESSRQDRFPPVGPPPPDVDEDTWRKMWEGREEGDGWAYVVEDPSLAEAADAHFASIQPSSARPQD